MEGPGEQFTVNTVTPPVQDGLLVTFFPHLPASQLFELRALTPDLTTSILFGTFGLTLSLPACLPILACAPSPSLVIHPSPGV